MSDAYDEGFAFGEILKEFGEERKRQIRKGYTAEHDDEHSVRDLLIFSQHYIDNVKYHDTTRQQIRSDLVKAGTMIAATLAKLDRQNA